MLLISFELLCQICIGVSCDLRPIPRLLPNETSGKRKLLVKEKPCLLFALSKLTIKVTEKMASYRHFSITHINKKNPSKVSGD